MNKNIFINDVLILKQSVRGIHYTTKFGEDLNFEEINELNLSCSYDVFTHKENNRDHLVVLELSITDSKEVSKDDQNQFHIIVEGHYMVNENIEDKHIDQVKHFGSLSNLMSFLRTSIHNITSLSKGGTFHLPLFSIKQMHENHFGKPSKKTNLKKKRT